jgi:hypothetical protein
MRLKRRTWMSASANSTHSIRSACLIGFNTAGVRLGIIFAIPIANRRTQLIQYPTQTIVLINCPAVARLLMKIHAVKEPPDGQRRKRLLGCLPTCPIDSIEVMRAAAFIIELDNDRADDRDSRDDVIRSAVYGGGATDGLTSFFDGYRRRETPETQRALSSFALSS